MDKRFATIIAIIIAGMIGLFWFSSSKKTSDNGTTPAQSQASQHISGNPNSKVVLIEYGDFECSACYAYEPVMQQVREKYKDTIAFQFRNFPLTQIHRNAYAAHRAAEAAHKQGKFWQMHDTLYAEQQSWSQSSDATKAFESYALELGLDIEKYRLDFASSEVATIINADVKEGQKIGANSTPTFVINGKKIDGLKPSLEDFSKLIDEELQKTGS